MKLLLLHPLPLDGSIFADDLRSLADGVAAPTLYAAGDDLVDWARAALDIVGDGPIVVVGNSIGGSCAVEVARLAPSKVRALVLCGAKPGHRPDPALRDEALALLDAGDVHAAWERYWRPLFGPSAGDELVARAWSICEDIGAHAIRAGVHAFHHRADREDVLAAWTGPIALVSGEHDAGAERDRGLAERLGRGHVHRLPGVGHYVPIEAPATLHAVTAGVLGALD